MTLYLEFTYRAGQKNMKSISRLIEKIILIFMLFYYYTQLLHWIFFLTRVRAGQ